MVMKCPHCGSITEKPMLFSIAPQKVFNFIWDNPNSTLQEIQIGVYGTKMITNVVHVHIGRIRKTLMESGLYSLERTQRRYSIVILPPKVGQITRAIKGVPNASL